MAELKDFGVVKSWYEAYKQVNEAKDEEKKKEDEKKPAVEVLPKDDNEEQEQKEPEKKDDSSDLKAENEKLKAEIEKLKLDISKKDAETNVEPNSETGEVPLRVGIAQSILDKKKKGEKKEVKEMAKDKAYAIGMDTAKKKYDDEPPLEKKTIKKGHEIAKKLMKKESIDENVLQKMRLSNSAVEYARKLSSYAVKKGGIDRKDFMKIADRMSTAKNDMDIKKIGKLVDDMDTEPRDLIKGSIALQMGPKTYQKMFGDRLTAKDMNQYKQMTPPMMREETLDEGEAYDNDRFLVRGNTAKVDNKNTKDTKDHVYAPNAKTAIAMKKKGVKQFLDTLKMRKQFPTYKEEIELDEVNVDAKGTVPSKQIASLKKAYNSLPDRIDPEKAMALSKMLNRFGEGELRQLTHAGIKFISTLAINKLIMNYKYKAKDIHDIRKNKPKTVFD